MPSDTLVNHAYNAIVAQFSHGDNYCYETDAGPAALPGALPELHFVDGAYMADDRDRPLRGVDVDTSGGHVGVRPWNGGIRLEGDLNRLEVKITDSGVLAVRQKRPFPSRLWSLLPASVELFLPRRLWGFLQISTASAAVEVTGGLELGRLSVRSASGSLQADLARCAQLYFHASSGSLFCRGLTGTAQVETVSGCVRVTGDLEAAELSSVSGGVELLGSVQKARLSSISGNVRLESSLLPEHMTLTSKSGSCEARLPADRSFSLDFVTASGQFHSDLPLRRTSRGVIFGGGSAQAFQMSTVSGNIGLWRY